MYVTNGNIQAAIANSSTSPIQQGNSAPVTTQEPGQEPKKGRGRGRGKGKKKLPKQENPAAAPLRPLAPRMVAVPISSPLVIAGNSQVTKYYSTLSLSRGMLVPAMYGGIFICRRNSRILEYFQTFDKLMISHGCF